MRHLVDAGLHDHGLVHVRDTQVDWYRACMHDIGLFDAILRREHGKEMMEAIEALVEIRVDGMGWSPEIAGILHDEYYLMFGTANPFMIIVSPNQQFAPIFRPPFSFVWSLRKRWFESYRQKIAFLTQRTGIWCELENNIDIFEQPSDLTLMDGVRVIAHTPDNVMEVAREQKKLVHDFMTVEDPVGIERTALSLAALVKVHRNLTDRPVVIDPMQYSNVSSFYTRWNGGWIVLRPNGCKTSFMISKQEALSERGVESATDQRIMRELEKMDLVSYGFAWWRERLLWLHIIRESFLVDTIEREEPSLDLSMLESTARKALVHQFQQRNVLPREYAALGRIMRAIEDGEESGIPECILPYLAHPSVEHISAPEEQEQVAGVVMQLLMYVCDMRNVLHLYRYDKDLFFHLYREEWSQTRKWWAIARLKEHYEPRTS